MKKTAWIVVLSCLLSFSLHGADAPPAVAGDKLETDLWYAGYLDKQPAMSVHVERVRHADGTATMKNDTTFVLLRKLGASTVRMEMRQNNTIEEDTAGKLTGFTFDEDQDNKRTTITGHIVDNEVVASVHRLGRITEQRLKVPTDPPLMGEQEFQHAVASAALKVGDKLVSSQLVPMSGRLSFSKATAEVKSIAANGDVTFDLILEIMPVPMKTTVSKKGELVSMTMNMMIFTVEIGPSDGPVALLGAELSPTGLVSAKGPAPKAQDSNRYRLPKEAVETLGADDFQTVSDNVVTVASEAPKSELPDKEKFLKAETQLELDDPELKAWVDGIKAKGWKDDAELAEQLRLAVRSHITVKDLTKGDASALEAFRDKRGDCTEHANLLCAALRIAGIPARTEVGLVFSPDYGGWVGHAWNSAYIGDRWVHLDSAYPGIVRSMYLKLATTSGDSPLPTAGALMTSLTKMSGQAIETLP